MTEQMVPMGGTALAEPPAPLLPSDVDESVDAGNRRKLMIVGVALAVFVVGVAAYFLTKGGGNTQSGGFLVPHGKPPATATLKKHHATASKPIKLPAAYKGHVGRDPFKPLYTPPVAAPASTGKTGQTSSTTGSGSSTGTTGTTTGSSTGTTTGSTPTVRPYLPVWVELVRTTGTKSATFIVGYSNGKTLVTKTFSNVLAPKPNATGGTVFGTGKRQFALLSVQNGEATIAYGDGTPQDIAPGAANRLVVR